MDILEWNILKRMNPSSFRSLLKEVLIISNFDGDEDKFIGEFLEIAKQKASIKIIDSVLTKEREVALLSTDDRSSFLRSIDINTLNLNFESDTIALFVEYLITIEKYLSEEQKEKIGELIRNFGFVDSDKQ